MPNMVINDTLSQIRPVPYKVYTFVAVSQTGTDAPVVAVLENTLGGTVVWTYSTEGVYLGTLNGVFTENKTFFPTEYMFNDVTNKYFRLSRASANTIELQTSEEGSLVDGIIDQLSLEVRVYP